MPKIILNLARLVSWPQISFILVNVWHVLQKNVYSAVIGQSVYNDSYKKLVNLVFEDF